MPAATERRPIAQGPISAIILAYNAGPDLEDVLLTWDSYLAGLGRPYEILLVDDASTDETRARAESLAEQTGSLRVVPLEQHSGSGAALRAGLQNVQHPLVLTVPCDKQYQPTDLYRAFEAIDQVDLVAGYRVGLPVPAWWRVRDGVRFVLSRLLLGATVEPTECWLGRRGWRRRWLARWVFGVRVQDPECPFRLYRREVLERLTIQCHSSAAQIEILAKANHLECLMAEVPVSWVASTRPSIDPIENQVGEELRRLFFEPQFLRPITGYPEGV